MIFVQILLGLTFFFSVSQEQDSEVIRIMGPPAVPMGIPETFTCRSMNTPETIQWKLYYTSASGSPLSVSTLDRDIMSLISTVVNIIAINKSTSQLVLNTTNRNITSIDCNVRDISDMLRVSSMNVTVYGVPSAPGNLTVHVDSDSLVASWTYHIIKSVIVSFNLSLHYSEPSKLINQTAGVTDMQSHNFNLEGVKSCDYFKLCVGASNIVGQGDNSCKEGSLPFIPSANMITTLSRATDNTNFTLTVTVMMPATCPPSVQKSFYILEVIGDIIGVVQSDPVYINSTSHLQVYNIPRNSFYKFKIISSNSIGERSSDLLNFCTNDVQGVNICSTMQEGVYNIYCNYVSGCNFTGCVYHLTGSNGAVINGTIMGDEYNTLQISDIKDINNVTVNDASDMVVYDGPFSVRRDVTTCISTTELIETSNTTVSVADNSGVPTTTIVTILVVLMILIMLLSAIIVVTVCLCLHGYCFCHESNAKGNGNLYAGSSIKSQTDFVLNTDREPEVAVDSGNQEDNGIGTADLYSSLNRLNPPQGTNAKEKAAGGDYSQLKQEPLYHVLENNTPQKVEKKAPQEEAISADPDAPAIPPFCPSGGDSPPPRTEVEQTTSTAADIMYAEVGNIAAAKK